jgi:hypothetical protein
MHIPRMGAKASADGRLPHRRTRPVSMWGESMRRRHAILLTAVLAMVTVAALVPPIPQPPAYHLAADQRACAAVPNCANVLSNVPFVIIGLLGLVATRHLGTESRLVNPWVRWPYVALFGGVTLTGFGSAYYHLSPDNARLVWDRLPMTLGFMGLVTALLAERVSVRLGRWLFAPLLAVGAISVLYWYWTETHGAGDLRIYGLVQFGSLFTVVLLLVLYPARQPGTRYLVAGLAAYAVAKVFELADAAVFAAGGIVSGHTLKHLAAAVGAACLVAMLHGLRCPGTSLPEGNP